MGDISVRLTPAGMKVIQSIEKELQQNRGPLSRTYSLNTGFVIGGYWLESGGGTRISYRKARAGEAAGVSRSLAMALKGIIAIAAGGGGGLNPDELKLFGLIGDELGV